MANDLNLCQFIGRLGADPEIRHMPNGDAVANFRIATGWKTKDKEGAEWISLVAFGKLADIIAQYLRKGSQIYASGRMRTRKWTDKDGQDRYTTEVICDQMQMLGSKRDAAPGEQNAAPSAFTPAPAAAFSDFVDDIPF
jgi:single-strand DNA-binding protein